MRRSRFRRCDQQRDDAADEGNWDRCQDQRRLDSRTERDQQQDEDAEQRGADGERQGTRRARLALDTAAQVEEVARRQLQLRRRGPACTSAAVLPRSRPVTEASTAMRRVPASRRMAAGPNVW